MVTVRPAQPCDRDSIEPILVASRLDPEDAEPGHYHRLVAVSDEGAVLGFIDGLFDVPVPERAGETVHTGPQAWGSRTAVDPDARGGGVGRALLLAFVVEAQRRGCTYFAAMVSWADDASGRIAFFRRCGLHDLVPGQPGDLVGAPIAEILTALSD